MVYAPPRHASCLQAVKYRQRYNWNHRDLLSKAHPKAASSVFNDFFAWITHGTMALDDPNFALIHAYEQAKTADPKVLAALIRAYDMTWEMIPSEQLDKPEVWEALAERMPLTALVRNLATLTRVGTIAPMKSAWVCERLNAIGNARTEDFARIHPINVLSALLTYRSGKGARGSNTWTPVPQVVDALDQAFERSFDTAPQTNQRFYLGIDVSGSMGSGEVAGIPGLTPRMAAAAMTMAIARREPNYYIAGFADLDLYRHTFLVQPGPSGAGSARVPVHAGQRPWPWPFELWKAQDTPSYPARWFSGRSARSAMSRHTRRKGLGGALEFEWASADRLTLPGPKPAHNRTLHTP